MISLSFEYLGMFLGFVWIAFLASLPVILAAVLWINKNEEDSE